MEKNARIQRVENDSRNLPLPIIGRIKVGEKNDRGLPQSLDYFKATGSYSSFFEREYPKSNKIQIIFISDDLNNTCLEEWDGRDGEGKRAGYSDGTTYWLYNVKTLRYDPTKDTKVVEEYSKENGLKWSVVLTLWFVIPKIKGVFGLWKFQTKAVKSSIENIRNTFDEVQRTAGTIVNIPFDLVVEKVKSQKPKRPHQFPVVNLIPNLSPENLDIIRQYLTQGRDIRSLGILTEERVSTLTPLALSESTLLSHVSKEELEDPALSEKDEKKLSEAIRFIEGSETVGQLETLVRSYPDFQMNSRFADALLKREGELS